MLKKPLLAISLIMSALAAQAQSTGEDVTNVIGLGVRLGIYNTVLTNLNPAPGANPRTNGQGGILIFPVSFDQFLNEHFSIGGQLRYNSFLLAPDTSSQEVNVAHSLDLDIEGAYHFINSEHTDIYIQVMAGAAFVKIANTNLNYQAVFTADGISYGLELGARFFIGRHFGILLNFAYSGYEYPDGTLEVLGLTSEKDNYFFTGTTYGVGLCYKFNYKT